MASIRLRGKYYQARVFYVDPLTNKKKEIPRSGFKTEVEAEAWATEMECKLKKGDEVAINNNNLSMNTLLDSIGAKEKEFKPVTVHLREDIVEAIDKLVEGKGKGARQKLFNGMLEMVLKENNYL